MGESILYSSVIKRHISVSTDFFFFSHKAGLSVGLARIAGNREFGGDAEGGSSHLLGLRVETDWV